MIEKIIKKEGVKKHCVDCGEKEHFSVSYDWESKIFLCDKCWNKRQKKKK